MPDEQPRFEPRDEVIVAIRRRLQRLTVAVVIMALAMFVSTAVIVGQLATYFAGEPVALWAEGMVLALVGFALGWFAGRRFG